MKALNLPESWIKKSPKLQHWEAQFQQFQLCGEEIGPRCATIPQMTSTVFQLPQTVDVTQCARGQVELQSSFTERKGWRDGEAHCSVKNRHTQATAHTPDLIINERVRPACSREQPVLWREWQKKKKTKKLQNSDCKLETGTAAAAHYQLSTCSVPSPSILIVLSLNNNNFDGKAFSQRALGVTLQQHRVMAPPPELPCWTRFSHPLGFQCCLLPFLCCRCRNSQCLET